MAQLSGYAENRQAFPEISLNRDFRSSQPAPIEIESGVYDLGYLHEGGLVRLSVKPQILSDNLRNPRQLPRRIPERRFKSTSKCTTMFVFGRCPEWAS